MHNNRMKTHKVRTLEKMDRMKTHDKNGMDWGARVFERHDERNEEGHDERHDEGHFEGPESLDTARATRGTMGGMMSGKTRGKTPHTRTDAHISVVKIQNTPKLSCSYHRGLRPANRRTLVPSPRNYRVSRSDLNPTGLPTALAPPPICSGSPLPTEAPAGTV